MDGIADMVGCLSEDLAAAGTEIDRLRAENARLRAAASAALSLLHALSNDPDSVTDARYSEVTGALYDAVHHPTASADAAP
jgi:hypothetical protein